MFIRLIILILLLLSQAGNNAQSGDQANRDNRPVFGGAVVIHTSTSLGTIDPALAETLSGRTIASLLFPRLISVDSHGMHQPSILEGWEFSPDRKNLTLKLRSSTNNDSGIPSSAQVLINSFQNLVRNAPDSAAGRVLMSVVGAEDFLSGNAKGIEGLSAPNAHTLIIRLVEPQPFILDALSDVNCAPSRHAELPDMLTIGMGPFIKDGSDAVAANLAYFKGRPYLDYIFLSPDHRPDSSWKRNYIIDLNSSRAENSITAGARTKFNSISYPGKSCVYLVLNIVRPTLSDKQTRLQIASIVDADEMVRIFFSGRAERLKHLVPEEAVPGILFGNTENPANNEIQSRFQTPLKLCYPENKPDLKLVAERIKVDLVVAGIRTELIPYSGRPIPPWDMLIFEGLVPRTRPAYGIWRLLVTLVNVTGDDSWLLRPKEDELKWLIQTDGVLRTNGILIPLFSTNYNIVVDPRLRGLRLRSDGTLDFESAWIVPPEVEN